MSTSTPHPKRRRRDRTFTGCLTCRRRKVKCDNPPFPCEKCRALNLECLPPFSRNLRFITSSSSSSTSLKQNTSRRAPVYDQAHSPNIPLSPAGHEYELSIPNRGDWNTGPEATTTYFPNTNASLPISTILSNPDASISHYTTHYTMLEATPETTLFSEALDQFPTSEIMTPIFSNPFFTETPFTAFKSNLNSASSLDQTVGFLEDVAISSTLQPDAACPEDNTEGPYATKGPAQDIMWPSYTTLSSSLNNLGLFSSPINTTETEVLQYYQLVVSKVFSVKNPKWNIYTYIFRVAQTYPYSPIRSSLLAWSGYLISRRGGTHAINAACQYHKAQIEVQSIIEGMHLSNPVDVSATNSPHAVLTPKTTLLVTMFFLCQCDVFTCSWESYMNRLKSFKTMLIQQWDIFSRNLQSVDYRLLLWLSYLDIRASAWSLSEQRQSGPYLRNLLDIVLERENIQCLYRKSRTYLQDAFQNEYPSLELRHDMLQDPANEKLGEAMSILGSVITLGKKKYATGNGKSFCERSEEVAEIRIKLQGIREECDLALKGFRVDTEIEVNRLSYHWLNLKATHNSALILLSRIVSPEIRTDEESQKAASEILQITLQLQRANMIHNPHFITSPFFIFVAGIEILDPIYQQWTLTILKESQNWGQNVHQVIKLLESIILLQEQRKVRINVGELIEELGLKFII